MTGLRSLPSVDKLLGNPAAAALIADFGRPLTLDAIRQVLAESRQAAKEGGAPVPGEEELLLHTAETLAAWTQPTLQPALNATGVVLHTNLGRAPLSKAALEAMKSVSQGYSNLEYDLDEGARGSRYDHAESLLTRLTGAEAALVVNNNAAAVLLALTALARRRRVLIARTQLVEIGGGFRIPEVMAQSGAILAEIGTTNRVHLRDYKQALDEQPIKLVMRAHRSNFRLEGFTGEPSLADLVALTHEHELPFLDDLGSGTLLDTVKYGLAHEPTISESLEAGADLICFSGDKLLGGPQAGIILGRAELIAKLKRHPLARALRTGKLTLAALSATLLHYLKDEVEREIPVWRMVATPIEELDRRAQAWAKALGRGEVVDGLSAIGGGSLPGETLPTRLLALNLPHPDRTLAALRAATPPIIARLDSDRLLLDPRTILPEQDEQLLATLKSVLPA